MPCPDFRASDFARFLPNPPKRRASLTSYLRLPRALRAGRHRGAHLRRGESQGARSLRPVSRPAPNRPRQCHTMRQADTHSPIHTICLCLSPFSLHPLCPWDPTPSPPLPSPPQQVAQGQGLSWRRGPHRSQESHRKRSGRDRARSPGRAGHRGHARRHPEFDSQAHHRDQVSRKNSKHQVSHQE